MLAAVSGCGNGQPYSVEKVSGKITYEDGSLIPANRLRLIFFPQVPPVDPKTPPKQGIAEVGVTTGKFSFAYTFGPNDGIIRGESKVVVQAIGNGQLVPDEYTKEDTTPLKVKSSDSPFDFKIPKPR